MCSFDQACQILLVHILARFILVKYQSAKSPPYCFLQQSSCLVIILYQCAKFRGIRINSNSEDKNS